MKRAETCGECGGGLRQLEREQRFLYGEGDRAVELRVQVPVTYCADCDEAFTDERAEIARHAAVCAHLGRMTPAQIKDGRARLGLTQDQLAEVTDYGIASIKRWESGNQIQNASADRFLRLLFASRSALTLVSNLSASATSSPSFVTKISEETKRAASTFRLREAA